MKDITEGLCWQTLSVFALLSSAATVSFHNPHKYQRHYTHRKETQNVHYLKAAIVNICALLCGLCVKFRRYLLIISKIVIHNIVSLIYMLY